ncbi:hypothetical protein ACLB2K_058559 [Fragaria x ananassa]
MAFWFFALLLFAVGDSKHVTPINQSHLQAAMADMRTGSYHRFVLLLKIVNSSIPDSLWNSDITFFMPNDEEFQTLPSLQAISQNSSSAIQCQLHCTSSICYIYQMELLFHQIFQARSSA